MSRPVIGFVYGDENPVAHIVMDDGAVWWAHINETEIKWQKGNPVPGTPAAIEPEHDMGRL